MPPDARSEVRGKLIFGPSDQEKFARGPDHKQYQIAPRYLRPPPGLLPVSVPEDVAATTYVHAQSDSQITMPSMVSMPQPVPREPVPTQVTSPQAAPSRKRTKKEDETAESWDAAILIAVPC